MASTIHILKLTKGEDFYWNEDDIPTITNLAGTWHVNHGWWLELSEEEAAAIVEHELEVERLRLMHKRNK